MDIIYIADYMLGDVLGGAEANDAELINQLFLRGHKIDKLRSSYITARFIENNKNKLFIISNFVMLTERSKEQIIKDCKYIIIEHDHKYLKSRDPSFWLYFKAPADAIINKGFYDAATKIFCQSEFHKEIVDKNLNLNHKTINLGGNLWHDSAFGLMEIESKRIKQDQASIVKYLIPHKGTKLAMAYCQTNNIKYQLIENQNPLDFLKQIGMNKYLVFIPQTPETLSRIVVEAKMMNVEVLGHSKLIGAHSEPWIKLKGEELIERMKQKKTEYVDAIENALKDIE